MFWNPNGYNSHSLSFYFILSLLPEPMRALGHGKTFTSKEKTPIHYMRERPLAHACDELLFFLFLVPKSMGLGHIRWQASQVGKESAYIWEESPQWKMIL